MSSSQPSATAVTGDGGISLASPKATAISGDFFDFDDVKKRTKINIGGDERKVTVSLGKDEE